MIELQLVKDFHIKYQIPVLKDGSEAPIERVQLRITLLTEELKELIEADRVGDIEEIAKEACDVVYVLLGTALELGYQAYFKKKTFFHKNIHPENCLDKMTIAKLDFQKEWSKERLEILLSTVASYLDFKGLKADFFKIMHEVHRSNMSKGTNGKPIIRDDGKIMKGEDFTAADLSFLKK